MGKDVAEVLGYSDTDQALRRHVDPEDKNTVVNPDGNRGNPNMTIIDESGLYSLVRAVRPSPARFSCPLCLAALLTAAPLRAAAGDVPLRRGLWPRQLPRTRESL